MPARLNGPIIKLDLLKEAQLKLAKQLVANPVCAYVHFAPPCGASSRARLIHNGDQHMPPPLRNDQYPHGLPWLTTEQQERVNKANELYQVTCELITLCQQHKILWSCENPGRSFMWQTTSFVSLFHTIHCESTQLHPCMYGSSRRKLTRLIHNIPSFRQLCQMCDNSHEHEPWGQKPDGSWATSEEAAYPWPLARAIAASRFAIARTRTSPQFCRTGRHLAGYAGCHQHSATRKHLPPMVPEFKQIVHQDSQIPLPAHARLLSTPKRGYVASAKENKDGQVTVEVHFSPEEFLKEAIRLCHPTEQNCLFEVRTNVLHLSNRSVHQVALDRTEEVIRWVSMAKELSTKERDLKTSISPRISEVLRDKRLCLLKQLLTEAGHEDTGLVEDITRGFDLTGALPRSGVFNQKFRPASMTCEDLRNVSNLSRSVLLESVQSSGDKEIDLSLFSATLKEVEKGFIQGPIDKEDLPAGSTLTKRFPVKQKNKVSPIDHYKASLVNFAVTQNEGVTIHTIDHIASMIAFWMRSGSCSASDGLVAKCWDLSDAYKKVPLSDEAFHLDSYLAVYDPECSSAKIFKQCVLPFGSIASVTAFLRVSLAPWKVGSTLLHLMWSVYFDDFLCLARNSESKHVEFCVDSLFSLLGWRISKNKLLDFNTLCKVLGVQLDLRQSGDKLCFVTNPEERVQELVGELDEAIRTNMLPRSEGEKLRGRLQFASSQIFGRKFRRLLKVLSNHVTRGRKSLSPHTLSCLRDIRDLLVRNIPRKIEASQAEVVHIYVDASFDYSDYSGLGGMLADMSEKVISFFSVRVDTATLDEIMSKGQKTVIQELEMMAVLAAVRGWKEMIKTCRVVLFTDSEAVRGAFLKSWSANDDSDKLIMPHLPSGDADILSRETVAEFKGAKKTEVDPREMWSLLTE